MGVSSVATGAANVVASVIWSSLSALARAGARRGWLKTSRLDARVVSVGNIQAGGAGKTPLVAAIAREGHERGLRVCILCRGYGGAWESAGGVLPPAAAAGAQGVRPLASDCGDEAALLHELAPNAWIGVGADRVRQYAQVKAQAGTLDLVVLDDGLQHYKIQKDLEIVALTSTSRSRMPYRDWPSALKRADLLVWTKGDVRPWALRALAGSGDEKLLKIRYRLARAKAGLGPVWLVSGVADSRSVEAAAREAGYEVVRHIPFPDHARYAEPMVEELLEQAARSGARLAVTGKDWVKWRALPSFARPSSKAQAHATGSPDGVTVLEPELHWEEGKEQWNRVLWGS